MTGAQSYTVSVLPGISCLYSQLQWNQHHHFAVQQPHSWMSISRANPPDTGARHPMPWGSRDEMETESESSSLGDDSVFWMDSEVITQLTDDEDEEREENFRWLRSCPLLNPLAVYSLLRFCLLCFQSFFSLWGRFGVEEGSFSVGCSILHSPTCPELVKCIFNYLFQHQEGKVLDRFL